MKKTYINPELQVVDLEIKQLIMTSAQATGLDDITQEEYDPTEPVDW